MYNPKMILPESTNNYWLKKYRADKLKLWNYGTVSAPLTLKQSMSPYLMNLLKMYRCKLGLKTQNSPNGSPDSAPKMPIFII